MLYIYKICIYVYVNIYICTYHFFFTFNCYVDQNAITCILFQLLYCHLWPLRLLQAVIDIWKESQYCRYALFCLQQLLCLQTEEFLQPAFFLCKSNPKLSFTAHPVLLVYAIICLCVFTAYTNLSVLIIHRDFYLDKSNLPPSSAPKAAFIDKVCAITFYTICRDLWEICVYGSTVKLVIY